MESENLVTVLVAPVIRKDISDFQVAQGTVQAVRRDFLSFEKAGRVVFIKKVENGNLLHEGNAVAGPSEQYPEGELLAELDNSQAEAALKVAQAELANTQVQVTSARQKLERTKTLVDRGVSTTAQLETAQAAYDGAVAAQDAAAARVDQTKTQLRLGQLRAPFDGVVSFINIREDQYVTPQQFDATNLGTASRTAPIAVIDPNEFEISVNLPVFIAERVKVGQPAVVISEDFLAKAQEFGADTATQQNQSAVDAWAAGRQLTQVTSVSPAVDPSDRSIRVRLDLDNSTQKLRDGAFVTVWIEVGHKEDAIVVPLSAIKAEGDDRYAFTLSDDNTVTKHKVELGLFDFEGVEVTSGLRAGDTVVTIGKSRLLDGMKVNSVKAKGADK
ncbi:efflux RND transporter periplasmic adaptor subunit [Ruegeria sp. Ofav3-42]|uniref:efflux RND transporter periplasmic adaptor subunit n=1 Tax=Ruegeria sp. Ofav3-42 TaxID=2917759 RepID=UPI001EF3DB2C|nr:efflux RND transporter periplasmic adaptor subunit [Ruegeria sp. Ofav3-42]